MARNTPEPVLAYVHNIFMDRLSYLIFRTVNPNDCRRLYAEADVTWPSHVAFVGSNAYQAFSSAFRFTPAAFPNMLSSLCWPFSRLSTLTFSDASTGGSPWTRCLASSSNSTSRSRCFLTVGIDQAFDDADLYASLYFEPVRCVSYVLASIFFTCCGGEPAVV